ncbi:unnamed protein product, partial [Clonostachys byssicola]
SNLCFGQADELFTSILSPIYQRPSLSLPIACLVPDQQAKALGLTYIDNLHILHSQKPAKTTSSSMCNYIYKELSCQHHYHLVESWCPKYIETQQRCTPKIVSKQYWGDDICAACRERQQPSQHPWAKMIKRPASPRVPSFPQDVYAR